MDLVSAYGTTTVNGLGLLTAFGFRDYDAEVIAALDKIGQGIQPLTQINSAGSAIQR